MEKNFSKVGVCIYLYYKYEKNCGKRDFRQIEHRAIKKDACMADFFIVIM